MKRCLAFMLSCLMILIASWVPLAAGAERVRIHGRVTDFNDMPQDGAVVHLKNENFDNLYSTHSGKDGSYELMVEPAVYFCMYAI